MSVPTNRKEANRRSSIEVSVRDSETPLSHQADAEIETPANLPASPPRSLTASQPVDETEAQCGEPRTCRSASLRQQISQKSSVQSSSDLIVPLRSRRGLFGYLCYIPEYSDPRAYRRKTKWTITLMVSGAGLAAPLGSAIILPALLDISQDLNSTPGITNLSVALYMLAMSIFPLWWSSFSESLGRRTIYLVSFALFTLWAVLAGVSTSISMFIVFRLLSGGAAASVQAVGAGTLADIWEVKERGHAMGIFYLGPLCGPLFAPIIGGALTQGLGWRSTQWFLVGYGGLTTIGLLLCLPETLKETKPLIEKEHSRDLAKEGLARGDQGLQRVSTRQSMQKKTRMSILVLRRCFIDPLKIILDLRFPAVALTVFYASVTFGTLYYLNVSIQTTFSRTPYNFSTMIVGLLYIPSSLGYISASVFCGSWADWIMAREARRAERYDEKGRLIYRPEDRMRENAWLAAFLFPGALIWYGWTAEKGLFWFIPVSSY